MADRRKKPGAGFWAAVIVVVAVLYVLSSGPARMAGVRFGQPQSTNLAGGAGSYLGPGETRPWYFVMYRPLIWVSEQAWGRLLWKYWLQFPIGYAEWSSYPAGPPVSAPAAGTAGDPLAEPAESNED